MANYQTRKSGVNQVAEAALAYAGTSREVHAPEGTMGMP
jgi:hypothetical protein